MFPGTYWKNQYSVAFQFTNKGVSPYQEHITKGMKFSTGIPNTHHYILPDSHLTESSNRLLVYNYDALYRHCYRRLREETVVVWMQCYYLVFPLSYFKKLHIPITSHTSHQQLHCHEMSYWYAARHRQSAVPVLSIWIVKFRGNLTLKTNEESM